MEVFIYGYAVVAFLAVLFWLMRDIICTRISQARDFRFFQQNQIMNNQVPLEAISYIPDPVEALPPMPISPFCELGFFFFKFGD